MNAIDGFGVPSFDCSHNNAPIVVLAVRSGMQQQGAEA